LGVWSGVFSPRGQKATAGRAPPAGVGETGVRTLPLFLHPYPQLHRCDMLYCVVLCNMLYVEAAASTYKASPRTHSRTAAPPSLPPQYTHPHRAQKVGPPLVKVPHLRRGPRGGGAQGWWGTGVVGHRGGGAQGWWGTGVVGHRGGGAQGWWVTGVVGHRGGGSQGWWDTGVVGLPPTRTSGVSTSSPLLSSTITFPPCPPGPQVSPRYR
jgi:hypothetical protein